MNYFFSDLAFGFSLETYFIRLKNTKLFAAVWLQRNYKEDKVVDDKLKPLYINASFSVFLQCTQLFQVFSEVIWIISIDLDGLWLFQVTASKQLRTSTGSCTCVFSKQVFGLGFSSS